MRSRVRPFTDTRTNTHTNGQWKGVLLIRCSFHTTGACIGCMLYCMLSAVFVRQVLAAGSISCSITIEKPYHKIARLVSVLVHCRLEIRADLAVFNNYYNYFTRRCYWCVVVCVKCCLQNKRSESFLPLGGGSLTQWAELPCLLGEFALLSGEFPFVFVREFLTGNFKIASGADSEPVFSVPLSSGDVKKLPKPRLLAHQCDSNSISIEWERLFDITESRYEVSRIMRYMFRVSKAPTNGLLCKTTSLHRTITDI